MSASESLFIALLLFKAAMAVGVVSLLATAYIIWKHWRQQ